MSGGVSGRDLPSDPQKLAAVMAAVQAYLNEETSGPVQGAIRPQRLWRMAVWPQLHGAQLLRGTPWKGRN